jgi:hypothetical protein
MAIDTYTFRDRLSLMSSEQFDGETTMRERDYNQRAVNRARAEGIVFAAGSPKFPLPLFARDHKRWTEIRASDLRTPEERAVDQAYDSHLLRICAIDREVLLFVKTNDPFSPAISADSLDHLAELLPADCTTPIRARDEDGLTMGWIWRDEAGCPRWRTLCG